MKISYRTKNGWTKKEVTEFTEYCPVCNAKLWIAPNDDVYCNNVHSIAKKEFESYEDVRESGVTNMFDTGRVSELSGLSVETITQIMDNYAFYKKKYS